MIIMKITMNDFTKEELIKLNRLTLEHVNQFRQNSDCIELRRKIQIMIDTYGEHEKTTLNYDCKTQCNKCEAIL